MTTAYRLLALAADPETTDWAGLHRALQDAGLDPRTVSETDLPELVPETDLPELVPEPASRAATAEAGAPAVRVGVYDLDAAADRDVALAQYKAGIAGWSVDVVPYRHRRRRLLVMDADSTLLRQEVIDEIADRVGVKAEVARITERAMDGELDFASSLAERVALLQGLDAAQLDQVAQDLVLTAGARRLIEAFRSRDWPVCVVSGGFTRILEPLGQELGLTRVRANGLPADAGNRLTGRTSGPVVDASEKERSLVSWADEFGVDPEDVLAVGDGANDVLMVRRAGIGVAYCGKRALREVADLQVPVPRLDVLGLLVQD